MTIRQVALLAPVGHASTSPETDDTAEVCATLTELKSVDEYCRVHCAPVGFVPPDANEIFTATLAPGAPDPPDNETTGWAHRPPTAAARIQIGANFIQISPQMICCDASFLEAGSVGTARENRSSMPRHSPTGAER